MTWMTKNRVCAVVIAIVLLAVSLGGLRWFAQPLMAGSPSEDMPPYPPPDIIPPAGDMFPYPLPSIMPPSPMPTLAPSPTPTLPSFPNNEARALYWIAQTRILPQDRLVLVESSEIALPVTGGTVWQGLVLDPEGKSNLLYDVSIQRGEPRDMGDILQAENVAFRQAVLQSFAREQDIPLEHLRGFLEYYPLTNRWMWRGRGPDGALALDQEGRPMDADSIVQSEGAHRRAKYGKLSLELYYLVSSFPDRERIPVVLWTQADYSSIGEELARRYPMVEAYRWSGGLPVDIEGRGIPLTRELRDQIRADYYALLDEINRRSGENVVAFLKGKGYEAQALELVPNVVADLPADVIQQVSALEEVEKVDWGGVESRPELDSVAETVAVGHAWNCGYIGLGVIGMVEPGIVPTEIAHPALQGKVVMANATAIPGGHLWDWHAAEVAGVLVGNDPANPQYRGMAYGAQIVSSSNGGTTWESNVQALHFPLNRGCRVVNGSFSTSGERSMSPSDRLYDYVVRDRNATIVMAAGNMRYGNYNVKRPGKAYNVITVGAIDDKNTGEWSGDDMWEDSCYIDPYVDGYYSSYDRIKPEVVAVGEWVTTVNIEPEGGLYESEDGTSFAAPQVSALAQMLMNRDCWLQDYPETVKAIIMASAIHNIEGEARLSDRDGAGGIDFAAAFQLFEQGAWGHWIIHDITNPYSPGNIFGDGKEYFQTLDHGDTYAEAGERVRAVICWNSNPSSDYFSSGQDVLATDFDLQIVDPDGNHLDIWSNSWYNSYEIVDFTASKTGYYQMKVLYNPRQGTEGFDLDLGLAWLRTARLYVPYVLKP